MPIGIGTGLAIAGGVGAVASIYGSTQQSKIAGKQLSLAEDQQGKQDWSFQQLQQLIQNPDSFFNTPIFQSSANQGGQAVARQGAAQFGSNSMNETEALYGYGESFASGQLLSQEQLLAGMSGTGFNPAGAGGTASGAASAATGSLNSLAGLMAFFGTSGLTGSGGGGSSSAAGMPFGTSPSGYTTVGADPLTGAGGYLN